MSTPEDRIAKDKRRFETWGVLIRDIVWSVVGLILIGVGVVGFNAFRTYSAHENDRQSRIYDPAARIMAHLEKASEGIENGSGQIAPTLLAGQKGLSEVQQAVSDLRSDSSKLVGSLLARMETLDSVIVEGRAQLKQNGDAVHATILSVTGLVDDQKIKIGNAEVALTRAANGLSTMIETDNPKIASILDHADTLMVSADGTVKAFTGLVGERTVTKRSDGTDLISGTGLTGIAENFNGMTLDSRNKLHSILYPDPAKGFWGKTKRVFSYVLNPVLQGGQIYFKLTSLPVRITEFPSLKK